MKAETTSNGLPLSPFLLRHSSFNLTASHQVVAWRFSIAIAAVLGCPVAMKFFRSHFIALALIVAQFAVSSARAHSPAAEMAEASNNFLSALTTEQRAKATFDFKTDERVSWHFIPQPRNGLPLAEMSASQKHLAQVLLNSALSHRGYFKAVTIMSLEQILFDLENKSPRRNPELYYVSIFGKPSTDVWGFRVEGHHLSLNFTIRGDAVIATTPSFFGTNPAEVRTGPRAGLRILGGEEDLSSNCDNRKQEAVINREFGPPVVTEH